MFSRGDFVNLGYGWLLALSIAAAMALTFAFLSYQILEGNTAAFDRSILLVLRDPKDLTRLVGPDWLAETIRDLTSLGSTLVLGSVTLAIAGHLILSGRWGALALVFVSVLGGQDLNSILKFWFNRPRPTLLPGTPEVFTTSFPSAHAMLSSIVYLTLGMVLSYFEPKQVLKRYYLAIASALTIAVGVSRVVLGVHWPTDVVAGWCAGSAWAILCVGVAPGACGGAIRPKRSFDAISLVPRSP